MASTMLVLLRSVAGLVGVIATLAAMLGGVLGSIQVAVAITSSVVIGFLAVARVAGSSLSQSQQDVELTHEGEVQKTGSLSETTVLPCPPCSDGQIGITEVQQQESEPGFQQDTEPACPSELQESAPKSQPLCSTGGNNLNEVDLEQVTLLTDEHRDTDMNSQSIAYHIQLRYAGMLVHEWHGQDDTCDTFTRQAGIWDASLSEDKATLSLWGPEGGHMKIDVPEMIEGFLLGCGCPEPSASVTQGSSRRQRRRKNAEWLLKREAEIVEAEEASVSKAPEAVFIENKIVDRSPEPIHIENKIVDKDAHIKKIPSPCRRNAHRCIAEI